MTKKKYDVIVVGAGHAGIEAALAASRLGCSTLTVTTSIESIGLMPCNPAIGGPAKGQIVGEIDALGGEMGIAADKTYIQMKVLNRSRGPAVQCLRSQNDKDDYAAHMQKVLCNSNNLTILEDMVTGLIIENDQIKGIQTQSGQKISSETVVVTTGTFLKGKMFTGLNTTVGGRLGEASCETLSGSLKSYFRLGRLKTGTPPRLDKRSIDFSMMTPQPGDPEPLYFSFRTAPDNRYLSQIDCYLTHTNVNTHKIILNGLDRSPLYTNVIQGSGPRYCPSIEDKVVRFSDKPTHQIFIEPEGKETLSIYPQGLNTSLPSDVQKALLKSMSGLEEVKILSYGYAVEYDFVYPDQLFHTLETKALKNLFLAGQINGTSGYEEAGGQGIVAGINAGLKALNQPPFILKREESYIGTMIDDLITKNIFEPYRMLTSRSEYRLLLRQDNAIFRLGEKAYQLGLISLKDYQYIQEKSKNVNHFIHTWKKTSTSEALVSQFQLKQKTSLYQLIKRPECTLSDLISHKIVRSEDKSTAETALINIKYDGYIKKQEKDILKIKKLEDANIPSNINFDKILGLKNESREKFKTFLPKTIFDAKKIAGINPADIMVLYTYIKKQSHPST